MPVSLGARRAIRQRVAGFGVQWLDFAPALQLPPHEHEQACIAVVLQGGFDGTWAGREGRCTTGTMLVEPAGERHANAFFPRAGARVIAIQPIGEVLTDLERPSSAARPDALPVAWRIAAELRRPDDVTPIALEGLALELVAIAGRSGRSVDAAAGWLARATELVEAEYARPLGLSAIASQVGVHPVHLARSFRAHHGRSVGTYLREVRVRRAAERLASTEDPIAQIALAVGFVDQSHLHRWFVRQVGATPAAYRRQLRGEWGPRLRG
jgi:AraC family transcriptional regulator